MLNDPEIKYLQKIKNLLIKLFLKKKIMSSDLEISEFEKNLVLVLVKKKFKPSFAISFDEECFNKIGQIQTLKKNEDGLKFVYKKALRILKNDFKKNMDPKIRRSLKKKKLNVLFYDYYFGRFYKKLGLQFGTGEKNKISKILKFFESKITLKFFKVLSINREYLKLLKRYFRSEFINDFIKLNNNKIKKLIIRWEKTIDKLSQKDALIEIKSQIESKGNKIPWTMYEAHNAKQYILTSLEEI